MEKSEAAEHLKDIQLAHEIQAFAFGRSRVTRNLHYEHYALIVIDSFAYLKLLLGMS